MPQGNLIKSGEIETLAPTTVIQLSNEGEYIGGGYLSPHNPDNPLPQHHTIKLTNLDNLFDGKADLQDIETSVEQAKPLITANRQAISLASQNPQWRKPFEQTLLAHEDAHRMQEIRFKMWNLQELPKQASQKLRDLDLDSKTEDAYLDKIVELDACVFYADALCEAQSYAQMFETAQNVTRKDPEYAKFLVAASLSPALKLFETAKPRHAHDTAKVTNLERLYSLIHQNLPIDAYEMHLVANQLGLVILLTQNVGFVEDIQTGKLTPKALQDDLLEALTQSLDQPTDFVASRGAGDLAKAIDLQLMEYVDKTRMLEQELLEDPPSTIV